MKESLTTLVKKLLSSQMDLCERIEILEQKVAQLSTKDLDDWGRQYENGY